MWYICEKWDSKVRENMETERLGNDIPRVIARRAREEDEGEEEVTLGIHSNARIHL